METPKIIDLDTGEERELTEEEMEYARPYLENAAMNAIEIQDNGWFYVPSVQKSFRTADEALDALLGD